jgi:hypothetical protein
MYLDYQFEINVYRKALAEQMKESAPKTWAFFEELNATGWIPG